MKNIIDQLYYGQICESENIIDVKEQKLRQQQNLCAQAHDMFWNSLSEEQKAAFEKWELLNGSSWSEEVKAAYVRGFKIGALIGFEVNKIDIDN